MWDEVLWHSVVWSLHSLVAEGNGKDMKKQLKYFNSLCLTPDADLCIIPIGWFFTGILSFGLLNHAVCHSMENRRV